MQSSRTFLTAMYNVFPAWQSGVLNIILSWQPLVQPRPRSILSKPLEDHHQRGEDDEQDLLALVARFLRRLQFKPMTFVPNTPLEEALDAKIASWGIPATEALRPIVRPSCAMADLSYHYHDFETKMLIAEYTWFMLYIDDASAIDDSFCATFQERSQRRLPQEDPIMERFSLLLETMWDFFPPFCANAIVSAAHEFVNGCYLEAQRVGSGGKDGKEEKERVPAAAVRWPYYLRAKTGVAPAYSFMVFPKRAHPDMARFLHAIPEMNCFIDWTNDLLSFHKEELAGEDANYLHNRADVLCETPLEAWRATARDAEISSRRIDAILERHPVELAAWHAFRRGYISFHTTQKRYRLEGLAL